MDLETQKRLATEILDVGKGRVWMDPERISEVSTAITRSDVKQLIDDGAIKAKPEKSTSRARARKRQIQQSKGRQNGSGTRKGSKNAGSGSKRRWINRVRPLRRKLREFRQEGKISSSRYRDLYRKVKGGAFRSKAHLEATLKNEGILEEE